MENWLDQFGLILMLKAKHNPTSTKYRLYINGYKSILMRLPEEETRRASLVVKIRMWFSQKKVLIFWKYFLKGF